MPATDDVLSWRGQDLVDSDGDKIGTIEEIYLDARDRRARMGAGHHRPVRHQAVVRAAARGATAERRGIRVPYDKAQVKDAPKIDPDGELSHDEEAELYRHYGLRLRRRPARSGSGVARRQRWRPRRRRHRSARDTSRPDHRRRDDALRGGAARRHDRARGRPRAAAKYVVEDEVTQTVPVRREEVRVEREPITDANVDAATDGPAISEEEHEVVLHEEEAVVEKRVVPKERVRLDKDVHTDEREVSETVRKEQIDVDDENGSAR